MNRLNLVWAIAVVCGAGLATRADPPGASTADDATLGHRFDFPAPALSLADAGQTPSGGADAADGRTAAESPEGSADDESSQDGSKMSVDKLATKLSNPVGDLWVITNQYNVNQIRGRPFDGSRWQNNWNIQPVLPLHLTDEWNLINRPVIPLYFYSPYPELEFNPKAAIPRLLAGGLLRGQRRFDRIRDGRGPNINGLGLTRPSTGRRATRAFGAFAGGLDVETERECGIGDITLVSLLSPRKYPKIGKGEFVWGVGPTLIFPTASPSELGQGKFQAGPAAVALYMDDKWVFGGLAQQWWSYADKGGGHPHTNQMSFQYFCWYQFLPGWQVGCAPIITVDWTKACSEALTLPVGLGIERTFRVGKLPLKLGFEYEYAVVHPQDDAGLRSIFRIYVTPVIPALVKGNILN